jgi:hypothetical protein
MALEILFLLSPTLATSAAPAPPWDPLDRYQERLLEGWRILVHKRLLAPEQKPLCDQVLKQLGHQLYGITRVVPTEALARLRKIPIWVELAHPRHSCMCYHPSADWLRGHQMNPQKAGAVEIANARNFLTWTLDQPWMVLHELAHGYHHQFLGYNHGDIKKCFQEAKAAKLYESVLTCRGRKARAYALNNDQEYFAEQSEAYFGTNDFYPFVKAELKIHDPKMLAVLEKVWGVTKAP